MRVDYFVQAFWILRLVILPHRTPAVVPWPKPWQLFRRPPFAHLEEE